MYRMLKRQSYRETFERYRMRTSKLVEEVMKLVLLHLEKEGPADLRYQASAYLSKLAASFVCTVTMLRMAA